MKMFRVAAIMMMALPMALGASMASAAPIDDDSRVGPLIVGGEPSDQTYSWMGSIQPQGYSHYCGASLIKPLWMVTAAHCVDGVDPATTKIRIGSNDRTTGGELAQAAQFIKHPNYSTQYDIAVIKLASPSAKTPIAVGSASPAPNTNVRLLGWGQTCPQRGCSTGAPIVLKQLDTRVLSDSSCQGMNSSNELCIYGTTTNTACYGDSGGPALVGSGTSWALVGATSRSGDNNTTCGTGNVIYEDVVAFKSWIDSVTSTTPPPTGCSGYAKTYTGTLSAGGSQIQPNTSPNYFYTANSGQHKVCLDGPNGVDFDLYLQKWNGSSWANVAKSDSANPDESITYTGTAGYYRYRVVSYSGSGSYTLGATNP